MNYKGYILYELDHQKINDKILEKQNLSIDRLKSVEELSAKELKAYLKVIGLTQAMIDQKLNHLDNLIAQFTKHVIYINVEKADFVYYEIATYDEFLPYTEYYHMAELLKLRYFISARKNEYITSSVKKLKKLKPHFSSSEEILFEYFLGMVEMMQSNFINANERFENLARTYTTFIGFEAEFYYHLSLIKTNLEEQSRAIYYGKKALEYASAQYNFKRILLIQMGLAVNFSNAHIYEDAAECYDHVLRNAEMLDQKDMIPYIYHNMADLHYKTQNYSVALAYFKIAQQHFSQNDMYYVNCLFNIGLTEIELKKHGDALNTFEELYQIAKEKRLENFQLYSSYYLMSLSGPEQEAMDYLENEVLPFTKSLPEEKYMEDLFSQLLVRYYRKLKKFDKAFQFISDYKYTH
ncbi:tetratricopeptide repeat protein [Chryseomicrobium palamuruense]|uniref:Tetratricopeptide repeat protein n=1 Tax=Chryseomicrobium palamuruense TaxID=682973 RepID=A0ABV8UXC4_9BACL